MLLLILLEILVEVCVYELLLYNDLCNVPDKSKRTEPVSI